jgi:hypothetical protein
MTVYTAQKTGRKGENIRFRRKRKPMQKGHDHGLSQSSSLIVSCEKYVHGKVWHIDEEFRQCIYYIWSDSLFESYGPGSIPLDILALPPD